MISPQVVFVEKLPRGIYTSQDLRDSEMYILLISAAHVTQSFIIVDNLWSGDACLFILHAPPQDYN